MNKTSLAVKFLNEALDQTVVLKLLKNLIIVMFLLPHSSLSHYLG